MTNEEKMLDILAGLSLRFDNIDKRFNDMDKRFDSMDSRMTKLEFKIETDLEVKIDALAEGARCHIGTAYAA